MKIYDLIERLTVVPERDIIPYFKKVRELSIDTDNHKGCLNCDDKANQMYIQLTESWTAVQWCRICKSLNVVYVQDRMGGSYTDTIHCYQENTETSDGETK